MSSHVVEVIEEIRVVRAPWRTALDWLTSPLAPPACVSGRRVRLLAWLLLSLLALMTCAAALILIVDPVESARRGEYLELLSTLTVIFTLAYGLNAAGWYSGAAWLTLLAAASQPWLSLVLDPRIMRGDYVPLMYASVSILLSSFLFSPGVTLALSGAQLTFLALIPALYPSARSFNWASSLTLLVITSALAMLASWIMRSDLKEIDQQAHQLAETGALLRQHAIRDFLTGLYNRRYLSESLEREVVRATRSGEPIGVIAFDADNLKFVNDRYGHAAGDHLLRRIAEAANAGTRGSDLACRCGGDEFVLVLPGASRVATCDRAEHLRQEVSRIPLDPDGNDDGYATISVGVAMFPESGDDVDGLLEAADDALYRAKRSGRDQAVCAEPIVRPSAR